MDKSELNIKINMMMAKELSKNLKKIYYVAFYVDDNIKERNPVDVSFAAIAKIEYIKKIIKELGYYIMLISISNSNNKRFYPLKRVKKDEQEEICFVPSYRSRVLSNKIATLFWMFYLTIFLIKHVRRKDTVLAYHSQMLSFPLRFSKWLKEYRLILEVEEVYFTDITSSVLRSRKNMEEKLIREADGFIFSNDFLASEYAKNKKFAISYGNYKQIEAKSPHREAGTIQVVYAGSIDKSRGAFTAVASAKELSDAYTVNIIGFGTQDYIREIKRVINKVNQVCGSKRVIFYDAMDSEEFTKFLLKCDIGLNCQTIKGKYGVHAFPSKILTYLVHGLIVISTKLQSVVYSRIKDYIIFCEDDANAVAVAIKSAKLEDNRDKYSNLLRKLDNEFKKELGTLLG